MNKSELRDHLLDGKTLGDLLDFTPGQNCQMFKAKEFTAGDEVIYVPDVDLNEIPVNTDLSVRNSMMDSSRGAFGPMTAEEQVDYVLDYCYTGDDFLRLCEERFGQTLAKAKAKVLFGYVDWQHPSTALDAGELDDEEGA